MDKVEFSRINVKVVANDNDALEAELQRISDKFDRECEASIRKMNRAAIQATLLCVAMLVIIFFGIN